MWRETRLNSFPKASRKSLFQFHTKRLKKLVACNPESSGLLFWDKPFNIHPFTKFLLQVSVYKIYLKICVVLKCSKGIRLQTLHRPNWKHAASQPHETIFTMVSTTSPKHLRPPGCHAVFSLLAKRGWATFLLSNQEFQKDSLPIHSKIYLSIYSHFYLTNVTLCARN